MSLRSAARNVGVRPQLVVLGHHIFDGRLRQLDVVIVEGPTKRGLRQARMRHEPVAERDVEHRPLLLEAPIARDLVRQIALADIGLEHIGNRVVVDEGSPAVEQ